MPVFHRILDFIYGLDFYPGPFFYSELGRIFPIPSLANLPACSYFCGIPFTVMKTTRAFLIVAFCFANMVILCISCRKDAQTRPPIETPILPDSTAPLQSPPNLSGYQPLPENYSMNCPGSPSYGDSVVYSSGNYGSPDYLISPVNNPGPGTYYSWPVGLVINDSTGTIDVTKSETGFRYFIGWVKKGTKDTCLNTFIIAGAAYLDSIYTQGNYGKNTANPYFNGNSNENNICQQDGHCQWDLSNNANSQKIQLDKYSGTIDLDQTLQNGAFGKIPVNGTTLNATIYYILDQGNNAIQSMQIQLIYYDYVSSIPAALQTKIENRRTSALANQILNSGPSASRPPIIIITRSK